MEFRGDMAMQQNPVSKQEKKEGGEQKEKKRERGKRKNEEKWLSLHSGAG